MSESPFSSADNTSADTDILLLHLARMRTWHTMFAVLTGLGAGLMGLAVALALFSTVTAGAAGLCVAPIYAIFGYVYYLLARSLWSSSKHIRSTQRDDDGALGWHIEEALRHQADFWNTAGTVTAVLLLIYAALFALALAMGGMGAMGRYL